MSTLSQFFGGGALQIMSFPANIVTDPSNLWFFAFDKLELLKKHPTQHVPLSAGFNTTDATWGRANDIIAKYGTQVSIVGGAGYETVIDHTGSCLMPIFVSPAIKNGDTLNIKFTVDGNETIIDYVADQANQRVTAALVNAEIQDTNPRSNTAPFEYLGTNAKYKNIIRLSKYQETYATTWVIVGLPEALFRGISLYANKSLKIEVETGQAITGNAELNKTTAIIMEK